MDRDRVWNVLLLALVLAALAVLAVEAGLVALPGADDHDRARVVVLDENGTRLAVVEARVADTRSERYTGLGDTDSLANGSGMLFVHDHEATYTYVMRDMDFPIDIVFVAANGTITEIHHARAPPPGVDGEDLQYPGRGKYVLEVPRGYTNATGIEEGDRVKIEYRN